MTKIGILTIEHLLNLQNKKCKDCNQELHERTSYHVDHIIPQSKGGTNDVRNLQLLCPECHQKKTREEGSGGGGILVLKRECSEQCNICNQVVEGFTIRDLKYKMLMHSLKHRNRKEINQEYQEKEK